MDLIPRAFQYPENPAWSIQKDEVENIGDSMKLIKRMWPLIAFTMAISPAIRDIMRGFVFEQDGQAVALANISTQGNSRRWYIGNVAVLPGYRRRGLARKLVEACINYALHRNAEAVLLDVISGNLPAYQLYETLGFEHFQTSVELTYQSASVPAAPPPLVDHDTDIQYVIEPLGRFAWQDRYALDKRTTPPEVQRYDPVRLDQYKIPVALMPLALIMSRLGGSKVQAYAVRAHVDGPAVAVMNYTARLRPGGVNSLSLRLDPAHHKLAPALVAFLLHKVQRISPDRRLETRVKSWQPAVVQALCDAGFGIRHEMHTMGLRMGQP
jgi:GNAT superfamily N-acetyltransferase